MDDITICKRTGFWGQGTSELAEEYDAELWFGELEYVLDNKSPQREESYIVSKMFRRRQLNIEVCDKGYAADSTESTASILMTLPLPSQPMFLTVLPDSESAST